MTLETFFSVLGWVITGAVAGYLASVILRAERSGCIVKIAIGIAGAFLGGFIMQFIMPGGLIPGFGILNQIITATIGAVLLLVILEIVLPGKQLGVSDDGGGRRRR
jgi:uncharacterized membrane protein YeaQ/YmgE (transglycosylase-associated protein family)